MAVAPEIDGLDIAGRERRAGEAESHIAQNGLFADADDDIPLLKARFLRGGTLFHTAQISALGQVVIILINRQDVTRDDAHFPLARFLALAVGNGDRQGVRHQLIRALADGNKDHLIVIDIHIASRCAIPADGDLCPGEILLIADLKMVGIDINFADFRLFVIVGIVIQRRFAVSLEIGIGIAAGDGDAVEVVFLFDLLTVLYFPLGFPYLPHTPVLKIYFVNYFPSCICCI